MNSVLIETEIQDFIQEMGEAIKPMVADKYILSSALQKAIRRSDMEIALRAGKALWLTDKANFWRRVHVAAAEDIGIGDLQSVQKCFEIVNAKSFRKKEWDLAAGMYLIHCLCAATKSRTADELYLWAERSPDFANYRSDLFKLSDADLVDVVKGDNPLPKKAIALWLCAGTDRFPSDFFPKRKGVKGTATDAIKSMNVDPGIKNVCLSVMNRTQWPLALFLPLIVQETKPDVAKWNIERQEIPRSKAVEGIPLYAVDTYTRLGKTCIRAFMQEVRDLRGFTTGQVGMAIFYLEGGLTDKTLTSPFLDNIRLSSEMAMMYSQGLDAPEYFGLHDILKANFSALNDIRERQIIRYMQDFKGGLLA